MLIKANQFYKTFLDMYEKKYKQPPSAAERLEAYSCSLKGTFPSWITVY